MFNSSPCAHAQFHIAPALLSDMADVTRAIDAALTPPRTSGRAACAAAAAAGAAPLPPARAGAPLPGRTRIGWWDRVRYMWRGRLRATLYRTELCLGAAPLDAHSLAATFTLLELDWAATHASLRANTLQLLARPPAHAQLATSRCSSTSTVAAAAAAALLPRLLLSLPAASALLDVAWRTEDGGDAARHFLLDTQTGAPRRTLAGFRASGAALALRVAIRPRQPSAAMSSAGGGGGRGAPSTPLGGGGGGGLGGGGFGGASAAASPFASSSSSAWSPNAADAGTGAGGAPTLWLSPDELRLLRAWAASWRGAGAALRRGSARKRFGDAPRLPRERLRSLPSLVSSLSLSLEAARVCLAAPPDAASGLALSASCVTLAAAWERAAAAAAVEGAPVPPPPPLREVSMSLDVASLRVTLAEPPPPPPEPPKEPRLVRSLEANAHCVAHTCSRAFTHARAGAPAGVRAGCAARRCRERLATAEAQRRARPGGARALRALHPPHARCCRGGRIRQWRCAFRGWTPLFGRGGRRRAGRDAHRRGRTEARVERAQPRRRLVRAVRFFILATRASQRLHAC
jgi:hypothetical protein